MNAIATVRSMPSAAAHAAGTNFKPTVVQVDEDLSDHDRIADIIRSLLLKIPNRYLRQLGGIHARTSDRHTKGRGAYHPRNGGEKAWIELFIDEIRRPYWPVLARNPRFTEFLVAPVLYHELGHHISTIEKRYCVDEERTADYYKREIGRAIVHERHPFIAGPLQIFLRLFRCRYRH